MTKKRTAAAPPNPVAEELVLTDQMPDQLLLRAIGNFILAFAKAEMSLFYAYVHFARIPVSTGRVVFAGARTDLMIEHIRALWRLEPPPEAIERDLDGVLAQMKMISMVRNGLVHFIPLHTEERGFHVSNRIRVARLDDAKEIALPPATLEAMCRDLWKIGIHLSAAITGPDAARPFAHVLAGAWRYTPPPNPPRKSRSPTRDR